jgi:hypothetical protein
LALLNGAWATLRETPREGFLISSKVGRLLLPDDEADISQPRHGFHTPMPFKAAFDYSYDGVMRSGKPACTVWASAVSIFFSCMTSALTPMEE